MLLLNDIINKYDVMKRYDIKMYNVIEWHGITNTYKVKEVRCNKMHQIINSCDFINMYDINRCKDIKRYKEQPFLTALRLSLRLCSWSFAKVWISKLSLLLLSSVLPVGSLLLKVVSGSAPCNTISIQDNPKWLFL